MENNNNRVRELRKKQGITQVSLSKTVGVSRQTINNIERLVYLPNVQLALKLSSALGTTVEDLFPLSAPFNPSH